MINVDKVGCYLLLLLFAFYAGQAALGISGLGVIVLTPIILLSIMFFFKFIQIGGFKDSTAKLIFVWLLYNFTLFLVSGDLSNYGPMRQFVLNLFPFFAFYYFSKKNVLNERVLKFFFICMSVVFVFQIQQTNKFLYEEFGYSEFANNSSYLVLGLLPFVFLFKQRLIVLAFLLFYLYFSIGSMKRAVLLVSLFSFVLYVFYVSSGGDGRKQQTLLTKSKSAIKLVLWLLIIVFVLFYFYEFVGVGEGFERRIMLSIKEGSSAGRDRLFYSMYNAWLDSDSLHVYIFGLGYEASRSITWDVTHNDLAKATFEAGILGLILFTWLLLSIYSRPLYSVFRHEEKTSYLMLLFSIFIAVMTSRWYGSHWFFANCLLLPYLLVNSQRVVNR